MSARPGPRVGAPIAVAGVALLGIACGGCGIELKQRIRGVRAVILEARQNGAYRCAPRELAMAESHADFTEDDLQYGDYVAAKDELQVADRNAHLALDLSPKDKCTDQPPSVKDRDHDGVVDRDDLCPEIPGPPEHRGCPDSDGDGVYDDTDRCPKVKGTKDNFGCPPPDADGDGVLDKDDNCPKVPGPADNHGCPDTDRDGDGVVDRLDQCPDVPGDPQNHGCPSYKSIVVKDDKIELLQKVHFATDRFQIMPDSFAMLNEIADVLDKHGSMEIRIAGHTDSRATLKHNMKLSQDRANSVKRYLMNRGVTPARMEAIGYGPTRPVDDNRTAVGRENNRRVEFLITKQ